MTKKQLTSTLIARCLELSDIMKGDAKMFGDHHEMTVHSRGKWVAVYELLRDMGLESAYIQADLKRALGN